MSWRRTARALAGALLAAAALLGGARPAYGRRAPLEELRELRPLLDSADVPGLVLLYDVRGASDEGREMRSTNA